MTHIPTPRDETGLNQLGEKKDIYKCNQEEVILDIQEMIKTNSWGFPFVSYHYLRIFKVQVIERRK